MDADKTLDTLKSDPDLLGTYLELNKPGGRAHTSRPLFRCPAPDHADNDPSVQVSIKSGHALWACHSHPGGRIGGTIIDAIVIAESLPVAEAITVAKKLSGQPTDPDRKPATYRPPGKPKKWATEHDYRRDLKPADQHTLARWASTRNVSVSILHNLAAVPADRHWKGERLRAVRFPIRNHTGQMRSWQDDVSHLGWRRDKDVKRLSPAGIRMPPIIGADLAAHAAAAGATAGYIIEGIPDYVATHYCLEEAREPIAIIGILGASTRPTTIIEAIKPIIGTIRWTIIGHNDNAGKQSAIAITRQIRKLGANAATMVLTDEGDISDQVRSKGKLTLPHTTSERR